MVLVTPEINRTMNEIPNRLVKVSSSEFQVNPRGEFRARSKVAATAAAVTLAIVLGLVDYLTGREWAISALYLLPTCFAGWVAGRSAGLAVGALCTGDSRDPSIISAIRLNWFARETTTPGRCAVSRGAIL